MPESIAKWVADDKDKDSRDGTEHQPGGDRRSERVDQTAATGPARLDRPSHRRVPR